LTKRGPEMTEAIANHLTPFQKTLLEEICKLRNAVEDLVKVVQKLGED
jgi:hypothetical protein